MPESFLKSGASCVEVALFDALRDRLSAVEFKWVDSDCGTVTRRYEFRGALPSSEPLKEAS